MRRSQSIFHSFLTSIVILFCLLLKTELSYGAEEPYLNSLRGAAISAGAKFDVTDEKFLSSSVFYGSIRPAPYSLLP